MAAECAARGRAKIITAWNAALMTDPQCSIVGRQLAQAPSPEEQRESLEWALISKRTATLAARLVPTVQYMRWARLSKLSVVWPPSEESAFRFLMHYAGKHQPLTRASRFMEMVRFWQHVLGAVCFKEITESRRLDGIAFQRTLSMGPRKQATPLATNHLEALEAAVFNRSLGNAELVLAGGALMMVALRSRFSDAQNIVKFSEDSGCIIAVPTQTKTSGRNPDRLELVMAGPTMGVSGLDWLGSYIKLRIEIGIPLGIYPLVPAGEDGAWKNTPARVQSFNWLLQELLWKLCPLSAAGVSSHSLKATYLSMAAKFGLSPEVRAVLGYHLPAGATKSVKSYERDTLSGPVQALEDMLWHIRSGKFAPDAKRCDRFTNVEPKELEPTSADDEAAK